VTLNIDLVHGDRQDAGGGFALYGNVGTESFINNNLVSTADTQCLTNARNEEDNSDLGVVDTVDYLP
jgi:hypothetical protein